MGQLKTTTGHADNVCKRSRTWGACALTFSKTWQDMAHYTHWRHRNKSVKLLLRPHLTALAEEAVASPGIAAMSKLLETQASVKRPKKIIIDVESTWLILFDSCVFLRDLREKSIEATPQALHWCFSALSSSFVLLAHLDLASQGSRWKLLGECARRNDARLWTVLLWNFLLWWIKSQCIIVQGSATMTLGCLRSERSGQRSPKFLPFNSDNERTCEDFVKICRVLKNLVFPKSQHLLVTQCYKKLHNVNVHRLQLWPQVLQGGTALLGDPEHSRAVLKATMLLLNLQLLPAVMLWSYYDIIHL